MQRKSVVQSAVCKLIRLRIEVEAALRFVNHDVLRIDDLFEEHRKHVVDKVGTHEYAEIIYSVERAAFPWFCGKNELGNDCTHDFCDIQTFVLFVRGRLSVGARRRKFHAEFSSTSIRPI